MIPSSSSLVGQVSKGSPRPDARRRHPHLQKSIFYPFCLVSFRATGHCEVLVPGTFLGSDSLDPIGVSL